MVSKIGKLSQMRSLLDYNEKVRAMVRITAQHEIELTELREKVNAHEIGTLVSHEKRLQALEKQVKNNGS